MIKTEIKIPNMAGVDFVAELRLWMYNTFGPDVIRRPDNLRKRKAWSITSDYYLRKTSVMCRYPEQAVLVRLRWL